MIVLGLTGSIGMGKTTTAGLFRELGARVWDADAAVHQLYAKDGPAARALEAIAPEAVHDGVVDRVVLRRLLSEAPDLLPRIEAAIHPLVAEHRAAFLEQAKADEVKVAVLDIPLLFETGRQADLDAVVVATAPPDAQRVRVLGRLGMTEARFRALLARQLPDAEKRERADFIVDTSRGLEAARQQVRGIMAVVTAPGWRRKADGGAT
ncbi:dephospho-CoA kinase [Brevundimonas sp. 2R-24]|uniref:Dephospho-CoA kinase n=1 Tax=Peiella sedimenti TaxID=3061083 RepID=A0ABT8SNB4_9CAUL|nr:dephospho-CoA kinase [Caulobacteraceae bacterium XZ-24]